MKKIVCKINYQLYKFVTLPRMKLKTIYIKSSLNDFQWCDFRLEPLIIIISHVPLQNFVAHASWLFVELQLLLRGGIFAGGVKNSR